MVQNNLCDEVLGANNTILQGQGIGTASAYSTAAYASSASTAGRFLRANGNDFTVTTSTYPDTAGASGNVLVSDGTNWSSSIPYVPYLNGYVSTTTGNPADSTTYYFRQSEAFTVNTSSLNSPTRIYFPAAGTIRRVYGSVTVGGTLGSANNCTVFLRKNNSSNTNITTTLQLTGTTNTFNNTGLSLAIAAGDFISIGFTCPNWTTNPTTVAIAIGWSS